VERLLQKAPAIPILKGILAMNPTPRRVAVLIAFLAGTIVLVHVTTLVFMYGFGHDNVYGLTRLFDLDGEYNVPSYFSFIVLLSAAALLVFIGLHRRPGERPRARYWLGLALVFTFLAADEGFELHERLGRVSAGFLGTHELTSYVWLLPYAILCVALLVVYSRFLRQLPPTDRKRVFLSGLVYVAGAAGAEFIGALYVHYYHTEHALGYDIESAIEESLEMAGAILFIYALLRYIEAYVTAGENPGDVVARAKSATSSDGEKIHRVMRP
jgi:hypothetical protein